LLKFRSIKLQLVLTGNSAQGRWPCVKINVNQQTVDDFYVIGTKQVEYEFNVDQEHCVLDIVYYNKTDLDTVIDSQGQIIENQNITVNGVIVNGVDLVKTNLIYRNIGAYTMLLDPHKQQYFLDHGLDFGPSHSLSMYENGIWSIKLGMPVLSFLSHLQQNNEIVEQQDIQPVLEEIYQKTLVCKKLTQEIHKQAATEVTTTQG